MFTCREYRKRGGILDWSRSISLGLTPSLCRQLIIPSLWQIRQQLESTGNTSLSSEYSITQRATFLPTPRRLRRKLSHSMSSIFFSGLRVGFPKLLVMERRISFMEKAFSFCNPYGERTFLSLRRGAFNISSKLGNSLFRARNIRRHIFSFRFMLHMIKTSSPRGFFLL